MQSGYCKRSLTASERENGEGSTDYCGTFPESARRERRSDVDAVIARDAGQAGCVTLADCAELPLCTVAVQLTEDHGGFGGSVLGEVVASELVAVGLVDDADVRVADLTEGQIGRAHVGPPVTN